MLANLRSLAAALGAAAVLGLASTATAATPEYFPLPEAHKTLHSGIATDAQGDVWFATEGSQDGSLRRPDLARLSAVQAQAGQPSGFSFFPTPLVDGEGCCARLVRDVAYDAKRNRVWFVRSRGVIGYASLASVSPGSEAGIAAAGVPGFPDLGSLAVAANGLVWFTESSASNVSPFPGNRIAYATDGLAITEFPDLWHQFGVPADSTRYDAKPTGIAIDSQGYPWFTEADPGNPGYRIGKGIPGTPGTYMEWGVKPCGGPGLPCSGSYTGTGVYGIAVALDDTVWFTNVLKNSIGRFDPTNQTFTEYPLTAIDSRLSGGQPRAIRLAPDGSLWVVERGFVSAPAANALIRLVPTDPPTATVYQLGGDNAPGSVTADDRGNVWFVISGASTSAIGRLAGVVGAAPGPGQKTDPPAGDVVVRASGGGVARVGEVSIKGTDVWATQKCVGPPQDPCSLVYLLDSHEYVTGFPGTRPRLAATSAARKTRRVVVGKKSVKIPGGKSAKVKISLNAKGRAILRRDGVLRLTFHATQKVVKGKKRITKTLKTSKLTIRAPRR